MHIRLLLPLLTAAAGAHAGQTAANPTSAGSLLQVLFGLIVVLGLMAAAAWAARRFGVGRNVPASVVRIVGGTSVGTRERVLVVEVADQWIVVGVAPGRVNTLATLPRQEGVSQPQALPTASNFPAWLKQTIEKRNAK